MSGSSLPARRCLSLTLRPDRCECRMPFRMRMPSAGNPCGAKEGKGDREEGKYYNIGVLVMNQQGETTRTATTEKE